MIRFKQEFKSRSFGREGFSNAICTVDDAVERMMNKKRVCLLEIKRECSIRSERKEVLVDNLEFKYWPEESGVGCSAWRLARKDNQPVKFPRTRDLVRLFRRVVPNDPMGLRVIKRHSIYIIVWMRAHLPRRHRERFLEELQRN